VAFLERRTQICPKCALLDVAQYFPVAWEASLAIIKIVVAKQKKKMKIHVFYSAWLVNYPDKVGLGRNVYNEPSEAPSWSDMLQGEPYAVERLFCLMSARSDVLDEEQEKACKRKSLIKQGDRFQVYRSPVECDAEETQHGKDDGGVYDADDLALLQWLDVLTEVLQYERDRAAKSDQGAHGSCD
jgi:hypothetical protein